MKLKRILSLLLTAAMLLGLLSVAAFAESLPYAGKTVILYTGNLRGDLEAYARVAGAKAAYEAQGASVVLVDVGNYLQGTAAANASRGAAVYALMEAVGYDAAALGLAEFGYGNAQTGMIYHGNVTRYYTQAMLQGGTEEVAYNKNRDGSETGILEARPAASFEALASGVSASDEYYLFADLAILQSGVTLGVYSRPDPALVDLVQDGLVEAVDADYQVPDLAGVPGLDYDLLVCLSGVPGEEPQADILIDCSDGQMALGAIVIDNDTLEWTREDVVPGEADPAILDMAKQLEGEAPEVLFRSQVILSGKDSLGWREETNLGDLVTDALLWYAETYVDGLDPEKPLVAIQNGGNCDQFLYTGDVTATDLLCALPFSPMGIGVLELTGEQLLEALEAATSPSENYGDGLCPGFAQISGITYTVDWSRAYDAGEAYGNFYRAESIQRVQITSVNGQPFDENGVYQVVADNYLLNGNDTYYVCSEAKEAGANYVNNGGGVKTRDIVALYVQNVLGGEIGPDYAEAQGRILPPQSRFEDVQPGSWYADAVDWAVNFGITTGTSETTFSPDLTCTHAHFLTFLYRYATAQVVFGAEAYNVAVAWAGESGLLGVDFDPGEQLTRADMVQYLYALMLDQLDPSELERLAEASLPFADVPADADYLPALRWAVQAGVIQGTGEAAFSPDMTCTRAQAMTVLYRMLGA